MNKSVILIFLCCMSAQGKLLISTKASQQIINDIYRDINKCNKAELGVQKEKSIIPDAGIFNCTSIQSLIDDLKLTKNDVFCDLGSGVGKLTMHVYLTTPVKASIGIESSPCRWNQAQQAKHDLKKTGLLHNRRKLKFYEQELAHVSFKDVTVISLLSHKSDELDLLIPKLKDLKPHTRIISSHKLEQAPHVKLMKEYKNAHLSNSIFVYNIEDIKLT